MTAPTNHPIPGATGRMQRSVAVVGAGLAGLIASRTLARTGLQVEVFEKARGPGGRIATRRTDAHTFDIGAPSFTLRDRRARTLLAEWTEADVVAPWQPRVAFLGQGTVRPRTEDEERYVGVPRMSALSRFLAEGLDLRPRTKVTRVWREASRWHLHGDASLGTFDAVLVATPPEQAVALLAAAPELARRAAAVTSLPCWAVMAVFEAPLGVSFDAAYVNDSPLAWAALDSSKPGRSPEETWVLHATSDWSQDHLDAEPDDVARDLTASFLDAVGCAGASPTWLGAHRWALASAAQPEEVGVLWDGGLGIGACGDWCAGGQVEAAVLSGLAAGDRIADALSSG